MADGVQNTLEELTDFIGTLTKDELPLVVNLIVYMVNILSKTKFM